VHAATGLLPWPISPAAAAAAKQSEAGNDFFVFIFIF
jgi:hypothetical protein